MLSSRPRKRARGRMPIRFGTADPAIKAPSASWGTVTWCTSERRARLERGGRRGGRRHAQNSRSPRARAAGLVCGRGSGGGVARVIEPASQASAGQDANPVWHGRCGNKSPQRELGDCDVVHQREKSQARAGWQAGWPSYPQSPGSRLGAFMGKGKGLPVSIEPASQASERQDAEASLRGVSAGQDARSERPARWHGQPRPTQVVASSANRAGLASEREAGCRSEACVE